MLGAGLFFVAAITALSADDIVRSRREALAEIGRDLQSHARVTAEQAARSLQAVDVVLRHVAAESRGEDLRGRPAAELHGYLKNQALGLVQAEGLALFDAQGDLYASSVVERLQPPLANFADHPAFQALRAAPRATAILTAVRSGRLAPGRWLLPMARRLETADGRFAGAVTATVRVDYFQDFYREIQPEPGTAITIVHDDGRLVARYPPVASGLGQPWTRLSALDAAWGGRTLAMVRAPDPDDGRELLGVRAAVPEYPLSIVITRDVDTALAPWRDRTRGTLLRTGTLVAVALTVLALLQRQLRRLAATHASLELSRERLALAAAGSEEGIWDWRLDTDEIYGSPRAREIFGLGPGPDQVRLADWLAQVQVHPDDDATRRSELEDHIAGRTPVYACRYRVRTGDGPWRWVRVQGLCERDAAGRALRMAGSVTDIDAHQRAIDELRLSEERYALAMTGLTGGHWVWEVASDALFVSGSVNRLFGIPPDRPATTRRDFFARIEVHPDDREQLQRIDADVIAGRTQRIDYEYRIVVPGEAGPRWILTRAQSFPGSDGRPLRLAGVSVDITSRKATEEALRRSEERYQLAVAGSDQGLWDWDLATDRVFLSPRAQQLLWPEVGEPQRPRRDWIAITPYHPDDAKRVRRAIADYLHGRSRGFSVEYRVHHPDGRWHWYRQRGIAVRDAAGRPTRMAGSIEDISERRDADAERDRLEMQLRQAQKLEAIGTLAGGIAHDFNNILAAILGYGEMALRDAPAGSAQRRHIEAATGAGLRAKSLVERILAFSRSGIGERLPVHVQSVVQEALDQLQASTPAWIRIERSLDAGDAAVLGDPTQVHQVVMNLCANAAQAMRSAGTLNVALDRVSQAGTACMTCDLPAGEFVRLRVSDTGVGIAADVLERIFDPFFTTKGVGVGTGLGLSLVHGIVTDLGGGIDVHSELGAGSTFTVYLPWHGDLAAPVRDASPVPQGHGETVLLVDDEESLVRLGEELIAELGYEPIGYTSSRAALEAVQADPWRFDAVLSDETMPDLTGSELAQAIRSLRRDLPVVLMSGYVTPALTQRAGAAGVAEVLAKPLVGRDIARALAAALGRP